jgi:hypothetical protein
MPPPDLNNPPPEPWHSFFKELDAFASEEIRLECVGGFVLIRLYGLPRPTADVDVFSMAPLQQGKLLLEKAGPGSELHNKHKVYLQYVGGIASVPFNYDERLVEMCAGIYNRLRFFALEPHDLALTKLSRNDPKDREDVLYLARTVPLDLETLKTRYIEELRPSLTGPPGRHDATLDLWLEMIREERD